MLKTMCAFVFKTQLICAMGFMAFECEFLPLQLEMRSRNPMFVLLQVINQNIQNPTTSDPKCSKRNMNHVDVTLMGLQQQK